MSGKEYTAKTIEEALEKALNEMMLTRDDIEYEVVTQPSKGFLGFGQRDAVVRVQKKVIEELKHIVADIQVERQEVHREEKQAEHQAEAELLANSQQPEAVAEPVAAPTEPEVEAPAVEVVVEAEIPAAETPTVALEAEESAEESAERAEQRAAAKKVALENAEEKGRAFLGKIFEEMDLDVAIDVKEKNNYLIFDLKGENLGILIGRRGDTLDSLQFLLNLVINEKNSVKVKGIVDIENYRAKREETLIGLSHKLAAKARKTGQKVVLEPMNPQERRIIHMALQNDRRVTTYSEGEEPYRKVVIVPEENRKDNRRRDSKRA